MQFFSRGIFPVVIGWQAVRLVARKSRLRVRIAFFVSGRHILEIFIRVPVNGGLKVVFSHGVDLVDLDLMKIDIHLPHPITKIRLL